MPTLTYFGHAAMQIRDGDETLLIDPFLTGNPLAPIRANEVEKCTYILVTHGHVDHLGDAVALAERHGATVICTYELSLYFEQKGIKKVHAMAVGGAHDFPFGRVKMTPALHGCGAPPDGAGVTPLANTPVGFVITMHKRTLYHAGDTALFSDMKLISERTPIHVACLPIGDNFTMGVEDAARANEFLCAERCVPMHFDTFDVIAADAHAFAYKVEKQGRKCSILQPGDTLEY